MGEDGPLEGPQLRTRLEADLLGQDGAGAPAGAQRFGLAAAAEEGEHQLGVEALAQRVGGDELVERDDDIGVAARRQLPVDHALVGGHHDLVQARRRVAGEGMIEQVHERRPPQERDRGDEVGERSLVIGRRRRGPPVAHQAFEPDGVDVVGAQGESVASGGPRHCPATEQPS